MAWVEFVTGIIRGWARTYVLHKISGPFFDDITASRTIIRGSAAYLPMANNLIDSSIPEARSLLCVLKGFHDLHNFVPDFWSDHVVSFILMHSTSKKQLTKSDLDLLSRFQTLGRRANESGPIDPTIQLSPQQLEQVSALHQLPGLQNLVRRFLCFRASRCLSLECYLFVHLALVSVVLFFV